MKIPAFSAIALAMSISAAQAAAPAAPTLTAGAEFKGLRLDWDSVPGTTVYLLEYRSGQGGYFQQQGNALPASTTSVRFSFPLHLYNWTYARYRVAACNDDGCTYSAEVSVSDLRRDAVGYFKSSQPQDHTGFGYAIDLSADGYNFVAAANESNSAPGAEYFEGGAAYVFRRGSDGKWFQRARIPLDNHVDSFDDPGVSVATSGTGNTIAVGMPSYVTGPDDRVSGEVDVYYSKSGTYTRTRIPRPTTDNYAAEFGKSVALSDSGYILAVEAEAFDTSVYIYKSVNGVWQNVRNLPSGFLSPDDIPYCTSPVMSRDGKTIAEHCVEFETPTRPGDHFFIRVYSGNNWTQVTDIEGGGETLALDGTGDTIAIKHSTTNVDDWNGTAWVDVWKRGTNGYSLVTTLRPGAWRTADHGYEYADTLAFSGDGKTLSVGDPYDNGTSWGPRAAPLVSGSVQTGAVYVYRLSDKWTLANMVKPNYSTSKYPGPYHFGQAIELSSTGKTLLVGVPYESSSAAGIDGDWTNAARTNSGAVFMY